MSSPGIQSSPPFSWTEQDLSFVAHELQGEFPEATMGVIAAAIQAATQKTAAAEGRVSLATATRVILRST